MKHVSAHDAEHLQRNPFPELHRPPSDISTTNEANEQRLPAWKSKVNKSNQPGKMNQRATDPPDVKLYKQNEFNATREVKGGDAEKMPHSQGVSEDTLHHTDRLKVFASSPDTQTGHADILCTKDIANVRMIRERVDIHGVARPMETAEEIPALKMRPGQIGIIKEGPTIRWLKGQEDWDKRYKRSAERVMKRRSKIEAKTKLFLDNARAQGLILTGERPKVEPSSSRLHDESDRIQEDRRWGPLDLDDERPPPTAIANRRDTVGNMNLV